jgi:hypothetical protein
MDYTLTRVDEEQQSYPLEQRIPVADPLEQHVHKSIYLGKLEEVLHNAVNWGARTPCGPTTSASPAAMWRWRPPSRRRMTWPASAPR